jgi:small subunit ribosomal protein S7
MTSLPQPQEFTTFIMKNGKKTKAQKIIEEILIRLSIQHSKKSKVWVSGASIFQQAILNVTPVFEIKSFQKGQAAQSRPVPCPLNRQKTTAYRWILEEARKKKGVPISYSIAAILYESYNGRGKVFGKKIQVHKIAEANRLSIKRQKRVFKR